MSYNTIAVKFSWLFLAQCILALTKILVLLVALMIHSLRH